MLPVGANGSARARPFLIQIYRNALAYAAHAQERAPGEDAMIKRLREGGLTAREAVVLAGVAHGASNSDLAVVLEVSERTVAKHLERTYRKLGVPNRSRAAAMAWTLTRR